MKKFKILIIEILGFIFCITNVFAQPILDPQSYERNLSKYWLYRDRLNKYFITKIGWQQGESIPASERYYHNPGTFSPWNSLKYGDATAHLSMYIAMLATEKKLLDQNFQPSEQTTIELYYALVALYRLDILAEPFYGGLPAFNGFFIRDDANQPSSTTLLKLNTGLPQDKHVTGVASDYNGGVLASAFGGWHQFLNEMSKDQIYWVLMGLSVVKKSVPNTAFCAMPIGPNGTLAPVAFPDGTVFFHDAIKNITKAIFRHFRQNDPVGWAWVISNPMCPDPNYPSWDWPHGPHGCVVWRGYDGYTLSAPLMRTYQLLTGDPLPVVFTNFIGLPNMAYHRYLVARGLWDFCKNNPASGGEDFKVTLINSMTNFWFNHDARDNADNTYWRSHRAQGHWLPTLNAYLFDEGTQDYQCTELSNNFISLRNRFSTSHCEGFWNYGISYSPTPTINWGNLNWSSSSALLHEESLGQLNPNWRGDFNGIDYMLWHNLWYANWSRTLFSYLPPYTNKNTVSNYYLPIPMPTPNPPFNYGYDANNTFEYQSFNYINAFCNVLANSNTKFRAGVEINLLPGFQTENGVIEFTAEVDMPICHQNGVVFREASFQTPEEELRTEINSGRIEKLVVFPIPAIDNITVLLQSGYQINNKILSVIDVTGKEIQCQIVNKNDNVLEVNVKNLRPGVYFLSYEFLNSKFIKL